MIISFKEFEARLSSVCKMAYGSIDPRIEKYLNATFKNDAKLIDKIYIPRFKKDIKIEWFNYKYHNMISKIKGRTQIQSISEFNEIFRTAIIELFENHYNEIEQKKKNDWRRYSLFLKDRNLHIIISLCVSNLFHQEDSKIFILTIMSNRVTGVVKSIPFDI